MRKLSIMFNQKNFDPRALFSEEMSEPHNHMFGLFFHNNKNSRLNYDFRLLRFPPSPKFSLIPCFVRSSSLRLSSSCFLKLSSCLSYLLSLYLSSDFTWVCFGLPKWSSSLEFLLSSSLLSHFSLRHSLTSSSWLPLKLSDQQDFVKRTL